MLTDRQTEFLRCVYGYLTQHGQYPTLRALMEILDIRSPNGVMGYVLALEKKGYLKRSGVESRCIRLVGLHLDPVFESTDAGARLMRVVAPEALEKLVNVVRIEDFP